MSGVGRARPRKQRGFDDDSAPDSDCGLVCSQCGGAVLASAAAVLSRLDMTSHVLPRFVDVFGGSSGGSALHSAQVLLVADRGSLAAISSLDHPPPKGGRFNSAYIPQDEAVYGTLQCPTAGCGFVVGLDRVACRDSAREAWLSPLRTTSMAEFIRANIDLDGFSQSQGTPVATAMEVDPG